MYIKEIQSKKEKKKFHQFQRDLYKKDPNFSAPFECQIEDIFTPGKNNFFEHGTATRFLLFDDQKKVIGRIAAFINDNKAYTFQLPTGGCGFFECINDSKSAFALFDAAKHWLEERGMKAMDGPINFGENDNYWGLLVEGFSISAWGMHYNPPYYQNLFEQYGFKLYFEQVTNRLDLKKPFPDRFWKVANWARSKPDFQYKHFEYAKTEQFMQDFKEIYDEAWQFHENFSPINKGTMQTELEEGKAVIDEELIWFAYHKQEPIAFIVMFPDANTIFRKFNGKLNLINKLRFLYLKKHHRITHARITIMGVKPKFQRFGIESVLFYHLNEVMKTKPWYTHIQLSWVGDFNPKMQSLHQAVGADFYQRHYTYRFIFDTNTTFERSQTIGKDTKQNYLDQTK